MKQTLKIELDVPEGYLATEFRKVRDEDIGRVYLLMLGTNEVRFVETFLDVPDYTEKYVILLKLQLDPVLGEVYEFSDDGVNWYVAIADDERTRLSFYPAKDFPYVIWGPSPNDVEFCRRGYFKYCRDVEPTERYEVKPWYPKMGETFYATTGTGEVREAQRGYQMADAALAQGNYFKTKGEAELAEDRLRHVFEEFREESK